MGTILRANLSQSMIYLDNNATTFLDDKVKEVMHLHINEEMGNPSSLHQWGQKSRTKLAEARRKIAACLKVNEQSLIFTSGATEALNTLVGSFSSPCHIITSSLEHLALLSPLTRLEERGVRISYLYPEKGRSAISLEAIEAAIESNTRLVALMAANNETGVLTDIEKIAHLCEKRSIFLLVDGVALLGKESLSLPRGVSAIVFSSHKIHGPTGAGLAIVKKEFPFSPLLVGGHQGFSKRAGTENLLGIIGMTEAISLLDHYLPKASEHMRSLRDHFEKRLCDSISDIIIHGKDEKRLPNTSNIAFLGIDGETLLIELDLRGIAASHGSACTSGAREPSRVLLNMGVDRKVAKSSLRFSFSRMNTLEEANQAAEVIVDLVRRLG